MTIVVRMILTLFMGAVAQAAWAQGQPVNMGSQIPMAIWFIGAVVLGLVMAYAIMRNRKRSRQEVKLTDRATESLYVSTEEDRKQAGNPCALFRGELQLAGSFATAQEALQLAFSEGLIVPPSDRSQALPDGYEIKHVAESYEPQPDWNLPTDIS